MSYSEENGLVILSMSREDYELLCIALGCAIGATLQGQGVIGLKPVCCLVNRLNSGNPHYTPYQVEAKKS